MMSGMKKVVLGAALLGVAAAAQAADLFAEAEGNSPVSWSVNSSTPAATYTVKVTNRSAIGTATMKNVRFIATPRVLTEAGAVEPGAIAPFMTSSVFPCAPTLLDPLTVECTIGEMLPQQSEEFTVTFTAPTSGDHINLEWRAVFSQGDGNSNGTIGTTNIKLAAIDNRKVVSDVPVGTDVTVFTGSGVATVKDPWVTEVFIKGTTVKLRAIVEEFEGVTGQSMLLTKNTSDLSIPNANGLTIILRRDASTIAKGAKIANAKVFYTADLGEEGSCSGSPCIYVPPMDVLPCTDTTWGTLPQKGIPCIESRKEYPRKSTGKVSVLAGYEGDWEFVIRAIDNGKYEQ
jgi:hypothetical protein